MSDVPALLERARKQAPQANVELAQIHDLSERHHGRRRLGATIVGLGITAALVAGALVTLRSAPEERTPTRFADGTSVNLNLRPGDYFYLEISATPGRDPVQSWWATDNSGRLVSGNRDETYATGEFLSDAGDLTYLSSDPAELDRQLRERVQPNGASPEPYQEWVDSSSPAPDQEGPITWGLVSSYENLLLDPNLSPEQRGALFDVAANLQGMKVEVDSVDPVNRPAIQLSIVTENTLHEWWFDPQSHQLLAMRGTRDPATTSPGTDALIVKQAGVVTSTDSTDLIRPFIPPA